MPLSTVKPEPVTTKGEQQGGQDHATRKLTPVLTTKDEEQPVRSTHLVTHSLRERKGGKGMGERDVGGAKETKEIEERKLEEAGKPAERQDKGKRPGGPIGKPDPGPATTVTGKSTRDFTGKHDEPAPTFTGKRDHVFIEKSDGFKTTSTTKYNGAQDTYSLNANTFRLVSRSVILLVPIGTGRPVDGRGFGV
ncbi:hypothetical protein EAF04_005564 [Stromatinia cepivora]|nr:hypothetical protein EAF04_005564 [Stromatinia cepivora]